MNSTGVVNIQISLSTKQIVYINFAQPHLIIKVNPAVLILKNWNSHAKNIIPHKNRKDFVSLRLHQPHKSFLFIFISSLRYIQKFLFPHLFSNMFRENKQSVLHILNGIYFSHPYKHHPHEPPQLRQGTYHVYQVP